jgi:two-component system phosphate regulon sensor histidine kinase PhoR
MKSRSLHIISIITGISLIGILLTQGIWLGNTISTAEKQFDHRADQMLTNVLEELQTYSDTSKNIEKHLVIGDLNFFDVVDTVLLENLLYKYAAYHKLDTVLSYALIFTENKAVLYTSNNFATEHEKEAYKVCLSCIWKKEYIHLSVFFPNKNKNIRGKLVFWIFLSLLFTLVITGTFIFVLVTYYRQKKIAEIKNDFVNNMTHELKTPLSTISVASEVLMQVNGHEENNKVKKYSRIIFDENHRMRKLVDKVLNIATLDNGRVEIEIEETDMHATICKTVNNFCLEACDADVKVDYQLNAENAIVKADPIHIRNIMNNLIDNAIKYSPAAPEITIVSENHNGHLIISVSDKGKGISKESQKKVFERFYRVPSGNIHNVKGFGLGLFYVKTMVEAHKGRVEITSALNRGTTVKLILPQ